MPKSYFYAVRIGRGGPFVYSTWEDCERATKGFPFARHKKFEQYADAQRWAFSTAPEGTPQERRRPYQRPALVPASSLLSAPRPATSLPAYGLSRGAPHPHDVICLLDSSSDIEEVPGPNTVEILSDSDRESEPYAPPQDFPDLSGAEATFAADGPLSPEQQHIFNMVVREHKSVFFTGSAGTGKSFLLRRIIGALPSHGDGTGVTAPTGIASVNIGGCTLHSWAGIGLGKGEAEDLYQRLGGFAKLRWCRSDTLIIDEISMCDGALLDKLDYIGRRVRHNPHTPFGGLQLVFCGDFFQLPPVPDELDNVKVPITFAFEARCWKDAVPWNFTLTHVFRQKEQAFIDILNQARTGSLSPAAIAAFRRLERPLAFTDGIEPTRIFPKKDQVKRANDTRLALLRSQPHKFMARDFAGNDSRGNPLSPADATKKLDRNVVAPASITLKEGAQVMLVTNLEQGSLVNGSQGIVVGFSTPLEARDNGYELGRPREGDVTMRAGQDGPAPKVSLSRGKVRPEELANNRWPIVKFNNGQTVLVQPAQFSVVNVKGQPEAQRDQVPLILAWALSVHKAQGQTLERVKIDLSEIFEKGQAYVALSRATTLEGLEVHGFSPEKVVAHIRVIEWAKSLRIFDEGRSGAKGPQEDRAT